MRSALALPVMARSISNKGVEPAYCLERDRVDRVGPFAAALLPSPTFDGGKRKELTADVREAADL